MSEYGFQSFPQIETVNAYTRPADHDIESPVMLAHQKHPRGNQLIREYMMREYPAPKNFESFLYVSQILQAEGIKIGAEHLRRIMPRTMGSLYWQIDDCWPVASWSSIDYFGRWKALQYYARRFYQNLLVSPHAENGNINVYIVSDLVTGTPAELQVRLMDFEGRTLQERRMMVSVAPLKSAVYLSLSTRDLLKGKDPGKVFLNCELLVNGKSISDNRYFFAPFKKLSLPTPDIKVTSVPDAGGFRITLSSPKFARAVYLSVEQHDGHFTDNYFDLIPGREMTVEFQPRQPLSIEEFRKHLKVVSLVNAF